MEHFKHVLNAGLRANTDEKADDDPITLDETKETTKMMKVLEVQAWKK